MDCTISVFDAHYERALAVRQVRMMDAGTANVYAQSTQLGMTKIWNSWSEIVHKITHAMNIKFADVVAKGSTISWNGEPVDRKTLVQKFLNMFGRRAIEK